MTTKPPPPQPRTLTFDEVRAAAERAHELVSQWPEWKRRPTPWHGPDDGENRSSMTASGKTSSPGAAQDSIVGDTVAFAVVLRVGRASEVEPLCARMRLEGALHEVEIPESHAARFHAAAQLGQVHPVHLLCEWKQEPTGLRLVSARATSIDAAFQPGRGSELLRDLAASPLPFTRRDYEDALHSLRGDEES